MAEISAMFCSHFSESRFWTIVDVGLDENAPVKVFTGFLEPGECAGPLPLYSANGQYGRARWGRSDGPIEESDVVNDDRVEMH